MSMEAGESKICSAGWQARDIGELMIQTKSEGSQLDNSLLLRGAAIFVLFMPSTDWIGPTHIMEGQLLFSEFTDFNVNIIQKHPES